MFLVLEKQTRLVWWNDASITKLLNEKNRLHEKFLSTDGPGRIAAEQAFKEVKSRLQYEIQHGKQVVERDIGKNSTSLWLQRFKVIVQHNQTCFRSTTIDSGTPEVQGGPVIIKDTVGIMARWTDHFTDLTIHQQLMSLSSMGCHRRRS